MTYEEYLEQITVIEQKVEEASKALRAIAGNNNGGLTPDSVRETKEFKEAERIFNMVFSTQRDFNSNIPKEYKIRRCKEHRARLIEKNNNY